MSRIRANAVVDAIQFRLTGVIRLAKSRLEEPTYIRLTQDDYNELSRWLQNDQHAFMSFKDKCEFMGVPIDLTSGPSRVECGERMVSYNLDGKVVGR